MVDYSETIEVYDIKVGMHSNLNEYRKIYMYHSLTFVQVHSYFSNFKQLKATGKTEVNLHIEPSWDKRTQIYRNRWGHITKMAALLMYVKTFKNLLPQNRTADDLETGHAALGIRVWSKSFKRWS